MATAVFVHNAVVTGGAAASGAKLYTYVKGTSTPLSVYLNSGLTEAAANPFIADFNGHIKVYFSDALNYKFVVKSADDSATLLTADFTAGDADPLVITNASVGSWDAFQDAMASFAAITDDAESTSAILTTATGGTAMRSFAERARERMSILDFMDDAEERAAALAGTGGYYNDAAVQAAVDWAMEDEANRDLLGPCRFICLGDITDLHSVKIYGPGWIEIGTGGRWYFDANQLNTGFGALDFNTLFVDPQNGDDTASGLAQEFALATGQKACDILATKGSPLAGYFQITLLEGVYTEEMSTYNVECSGDNPLYIFGPDPASVWDNTDPPDDGVALTSVTAATPPVATSTSHGLLNDEHVFWGKVTKSGGAHQGDGAIYLVKNKTANTYELYNLDGTPVNGTTWSAITGGYGWRLHKSRSKAVYYGTGTNFVGVRVTRDTYGDVRNIFGVNCGSDSSTDNGGVVVFSEGANGYARNVQAAKSQMAFMGREAHDGVTMLGGGAVDCWNGARLIDARFTIGGANLTATSTTTPFFKRCFRPIEAWEGANGHADGVKYQDCNFLPFVWKGGQLTAHYCQHTNTTGSPARGYVVDSSGYAEIDTDNSKNTWTGEYNPRLELRSFASINVTTETAYTWRTMDTTRGVVTPAGGEITFLTLPISQDSFNFYPQGFRIMTRGTGTNANGNLVWRIKKGSTTLYSRTIASNATAREIRHDFSLIATGFDALQIDMIEHLLTGSTTTVAYDINSASFDTSSANDTFTMTVEVVHASDTHTVQHSALETLGC